VHVNAKCTLFAAPKVAGMMSEYYNGISIEIARCLCKLQRDKFSERSPVRFKAINFGGREIPLSGWR
jgi:hypothetical protein